ncbi:MAG TPA: hypothetical protein VGN63_02090 [Flavisolibacter sp.]|jgi:hypothetical protein|nr:hypothetical protein [Flavisolibacter sp.]
MKTRIFLFIICLVLLATQQGKAQSRADKVLADVAAKKAAREKQLAQVRIKVAEQKGQLQYEKKLERNSELPPPAQGGNGQGLGGSARVPESTVTANRAAGKN